jgi:hypothetical protein
MTKAAAKPRRAAKGIKFDESDLATFRRYVDKRVGADWILAVDPGSSSTGWALCDPMNGDEILSGQGPNAHVACELVRAGHSSALLLVVEAPYSGRSPEAVLGDDGTPQIRGTRASPESTWKLGRAMGFVQGALYSDRYMRGMNPGLLWEPAPMRWRAVLGLNPTARGKGARAEVAERCWRYARSITGRDLEGPMGGRLIDEAMAICMLDAARRIARAVSAAPKASAA